MMAVALAGARMAVARAGAVVLGVCQAARARICVLVCLAVEDLPVLRAGAPAPFQIVVCIRIEHATAAIKKAQRASSFKQPTHQMCRSPLAHDERVEVLKECLCFAKKDCRESGALSRFLLKGSYLGSAPFLVQS